MSQSISIYKTTLDNMYKSIKHRSSSTRVPQLKVEFQIA